MHGVSGFFETNVATLFFELVLSTGVAKSEILGQAIIVVGEVDASFDIFIVVIGVGATSLALEAVLAFPLLWHVGDFWL